MAKKKKRAQRPPSAPSFGSSALAEQLSRASITQKVKPHSDTRASHVAPPPERDQPLPPEALLDGEDLFLAALDAMPEPSALQKKRGSSAFHGDFARQLHGHTPLAQRREAERDASPDAPHLPVPEPAIPDAPDEALDESPLEGEALFAHVVDGMTPQDLFAGKYHGSVRNVPSNKQKPAPFAPGGAPQSQALSKKEREAEEQRAREEVAELREELLFTRAVGGFDEVFSNQDKYHRQTPRVYRESESRAAGYSSESPEGLITPPLPKSGEGLHHVPSLDASQRGLLNRARLWGRKNQMEVLNVRGDGVEDALRQLELFVHQQWKDGARYIRLIHGKGLQSEEGVPVLKPSVLHWLEGPGFRYVRGYAPELAHDNDYGSVLVCLTQRDSRDKE